MFKQPRVFCTGAVIQRRQFDVAGRITLEQLAVMPLHDVEMSDEILREGFTALIAEEVRKAFHGLGTIG